MYVFFVKLSSKMLILIAKIVERQKGKKYIKFSDDGDNLHNNFYIFKAK